MAWHRRRAACRVVVVGITPCSLLPTAPTVAYTTPPFPSLLVGFVLPALRRGSLPRSRTIWVTAAVDSCAPGCLGRRCPRGSPLRTATPRRGAEVSLVRRLSRALTVPARG